MSINIRIIVLYGVYFLSLIKNAQNEVIEDVKYAKSSLSSIEIQRNNGCLDDSSITEEKILIIIKENVALVIALSIICGLLSGIILLLIIATYIYYFIKRRDKINFNNDDNNDKKKTFRRPKIFIDNPAQLQDPDCMEKGQSPSTLSLGSTHDSESNNKFSPLETTPGYYMNNYNDNKENEKNYNISIDDLIIEEDIIVGSTGKICKAIYKDKNGEEHEVAVKYLNKEVISNNGGLQEQSLNIIESELKVMSIVPSHSNVIKCYGGNVTTTKITSESTYPLSIDKNDDDVHNCFIVEEWMKYNLHAIIHNGIFLNNNIPIDTLLFISISIVKGLDHLHRYNVIHYDVKPSNILLNDNFDAKLADFGFSKIKCKSYVSGSLRGTLGYMAPEVHLSHFLMGVKICEKVDIYSFGVVLWEMITGKIPPEPNDSSVASSYKSTNYSFQTHSEGNYYNCSLLNDPDFIKCDPELKEIIIQCVQTNPRDRPSSRKLLNNLYKMYNKSLFTKALAARLNR